MKKMDDICWGCFGASFGDCQDCPTRKRCETEFTLDVKDMKMHTDLHKEGENGEEEKVLRHY